MSIVFEDVHLSYGDRVVLRGVSATLSEHRIGIIGENGSGKSTLARMINGLVRPDCGRVQVDGLDVAKDAKAVRRRVGFLFPDADHQIVMPTVREDLDFSLRTSNLPREERRRMVDAALTAYGLADHADHPCHLLSSGQKQMLALAAVLLVQPSIIVADEPTTLLDLRNVRATQRRLAALSQRVVLVTHHLGLLADYDRVLLIHDGVIAADGAPSEVIAHYEGLMV